MKLSKTEKQLIAINLKSDERFDEVFEAVEMILDGHIKIAKLQGAQELLNDMLKDNEEKTKKYLKDRA